MKNSRILFTSISQEIRTHMNAIVGFSFLLEDKNACDREDMKYRNQILTSCKKLMWLFDSFLEVLIDDKSDYRISQNRCKLYKFLDEIISEFRELVLQDNYTDIVLLSGNHYSDLSEVYFDPSNVKMVLDCMIRNAINNSKTGQVKVGYHLYFGKVTFYVFDTGQDHLKCREFLHSDVMENSLAIYQDASTAINIILAKELVKAMDGNIWFDQNDIAGTAAYFSIPVISNESIDVSIRNYHKSISIQLN